MAERQRIKGLDKLFPGETITIGDSTLIITPLDLTSLHSIGLRVKDLLSDFKEAGITWDNFSTYASIFQIAFILLAKAPDVLAEITNIHEDDIKGLDPAHAVALIQKAIEVNMKAHDVLIKNWTSLIETLPLQSLMKKGEETTKTMEESGSSKSSNS